MNLLTWRQPAPLARWQQAGFSPDVLAGPREGDARDTHTGIVAHEPPGEPLPDGPFERVAAAIARFDVFPGRLAQAVRVEKPLEVGDTLGLRYPLLPGLSLFFACRVIELIESRDGAWVERGFTYRTLPGHVALGEESFLVAKDIRTGEVHATLRSWSRPGLWLTRIGRPYMRWCQRDAGRRAIAHLREVADART